MNVSISDCKLVDLPKITDPRGSLSFAENDRHLPFQIKRVFYLYDVPQGLDRGAHAHRELYQFLLPVSGSFDVEVDDGTSTKTLRLEKPWQGLIVPPMIWATEKNFAENTVCMVLASDVFDEADYIRDYGQYLQLVGKDN